VLSAKQWRHLKTEVSLLKRIKCIPFTLLWKNFKTAAMVGRVGFVLRKTRAGKSHDYSAESLRFQIIFRSHENERSAGVFKFLCFEELFRKAAFARRISVEAG